MSSFSPSPITQSVAAGRPQHVHNTLPALRTPCPLHYLAMLCIGKQGLGASFSSCVLCVWWYVCVCMSVLWSCMYCLCVIYTVCICVCMCACVVCVICSIYGMNVACVCVYTVMCIESRSGVLVSFFRSFPSCYFFNQGLSNLCSKLFTNPCSLGNIFMYR